MARRKNEVVEDAAEIGLLASPTRIDIVDTLDALGTAVTVAELAAELGRPADGLYYHLRQLAEHGLIEEEIASDGRRYRSRARDGQRMRLRYRPGATANAEAVGRVASGILRVAGRDFSRALADPQSVVEGTGRELWAARSKGWVSATELAEINRLLARLGQLLQRPRKTRDERLVALSWVLAPLDAKPARRGEDAPAPRRRKAANATPRRSR
jgi:DNA-binding transcriptional ArsR family regulator